jgi:hypothetical protein
MADMTQLGGYNDKNNKLLTKTAVLFSSSLVTIQHTLVIREAAQPYTVVI